LISLDRLEARFIKLTDTGFQRVETIAEASGVMFLCPKCFADIKGKGCHSIVCWFEGKVSDLEMPGPGRWTPTGTTIQELTLSPSINLSGGGCGWHGFVQNGQAS